MKRWIGAAAWTLMALGAAAPLARAADDTPAKPAPAKAAPGRAGAFAQKLYDRVSPSLVAVQYTWEFELGRRDVIGAGVVVSEDGLVMTSLGLIPNEIPDAQLKDFKILIPSQEKDAEELDAEFEGRDERTNTAFLKVKQKRDWKPIKFVNAPVQIGEPIWSVGLLPKSVAYKPYLMESNVSITLRGDVPQVLVQGAGLAAATSPVFNRKGQAIGLVSAQFGQNILLNHERVELSFITNPPKFYTPAGDFLMSLADPPIAGKSLQLPWIGVPQMTGLSKDVAEAYNLGDQPAVQVGDVVPNTPAAEAGLKQGDVIVKLNGEPLERGDEPKELPGIMARQVRRMKVGDEITLSVIRKRGEKPQDIKIKLAAQPEQQNTAKRFYAEDLGFGVRDMVFFDRYGRRLPADADGVVVSLIRPQGAAQNGRLQGTGDYLESDVIIQLNGQPVKDVDAFEKLYKAARKDKPKDPLVLVVRREGREDTVRIEPPQ